MESYQEIMSLVEEVRDILDLHEIKGLSLARKEKIFNKIKGSHPSGADHPEAHGHAQKTLANIKKGHAASTRHNPFKNIKKGKHLGGTSKAVAKIKGPSTTTPGVKRKRWRCRCSNYHCLCTGKTAEGKSTIKHVEIKRQYKKGYNMRYKEWRKKHAKLFAAGGKRGFTKAAKPHHKKYHEA